MAAYTAIDDPSAYFKVQLYTGDGAANNAITFDDTDTDMQPDLVWIKNRDTTDGHCLFDALRGATKLLDTQSNAVETTDTDTLDSFASDGFQVDADVKVNTNTEKYVSWNWKESATAGFDIVAYSGTGSAKTESHSLSAVPYLMIVKRRTNAINDWAVYHHKNTSAPETDYLRLSTTNATTDSVYIWNDTAPTSSVFSVGTGSETNDSTSTNIAYLWSEKQGYSKFGGYTGNGNADGTFVYTGFRPAWVMIKRTDAARSWAIYDSIRYPENLASIPALWADRNNVEGAYTTVDFLSNGFKIRDTSATINTSGGDYIFMAFAEAPFVNSNGVPCNAR